MGMSSTLKMIISPSGVVSFFQGLKKEYGIKFMLMVLSNYIGVRGALRRFLDLNETAYYREAGYPSSVNQTNQAISKLPGAIMGVGGILSDLLPFAGYEKSSYMFVYTICGTFSLLFLILIPFSAETHSPIAPALLFFLCNTQVNYGDLLMTAKMIELMRLYPKNRGSLITLEHIGYVIGGLIPASLVGVLADTLSSPRYTFWIALPFAAQPIIFLLAGCFVNDRASPSRNNRFDYNKAKAQMPIIVLNIIMFAAAMGSLLCGLFTTPNITFAYSILVSIVLHMGSFVCLPIVVALINLYLYLGQAMYLQIQPTLEYFYLAEEDCVPGGPNFDFTYLKTYIGIVTQFGQFIGVWLYQAVLTRFKYRQIFWISTVLRLIASFFDLFIVNRWNILIGIPDRFFYLFGHAIMYEITYMLDFMPFTLMIAKVCPQNIESILFALLGSYTLYGTTISIFTGGFVTSMLGIDSGVESSECNFDNLGYAVLICNLLLPSLLIPLAFLLIPNKPVGENIADKAFEDSPYLFSCIKYTRIENTPIPNEINTK